MFCGKTHEWNKILEEAAVSGLAKGAWTETKESIDNVSMINSRKAGIVSGIISITEMIRNG